MVELSPLLLSAKLAFITTTILFMIAIPICYWLSKTKSNFKIIIESLISLPLVLPPSVLGLYLLIAFSPNQFFGEFLENYFHFNLLFSFEGLVVCSILYSFPFMINPILSGFKSLPPSLEEASYILGKSKTKTLFKILLPNIKPAIITGIVMSFAHTVGEFGVVLMVGGNIPNETKVVSLAIYDEVQALNYSNANIYAIILLGFSFITLIITNLINKKMHLYDKH
jgi:molybdate transport system permease protein